MNMKLWRDFYGGFLLTKFRDSIAHVFIKGKKKYPFENGYFIVILCKIL